MEIIATNVNGAVLGFEAGVYYMKKSGCDFFEEIPAVSEDNAWDYFLKFCKNKK